MYDHAVKSACSLSTRPPQGLVLRLLYKSEDIGCMGGEFNVHISNMSIYSIQHAIMHTQHAIMHAQYAVMHTLQKRWSDVHSN